MCGYGLDLYGLELKNLAEFMQKYTPDIYETCEGDIRDSYGESVFRDKKKLNDCIKNWLENYEEDGYFGIAAYLANTIEEQEDIILYAYDDDCDFVYLPTLLPWEYSKKERSLSEEDLHNIFRKYIGQICEKKLNFRFMSIDEQNRF